MHHFMRRSLSLLRTTVVNRNWRSLDGAPRRHMTNTSSPVKLHAAEVAPDHRVDDQVHHIIILHGLFGSGQNWRTIATTLASYNLTAPFHCHLLDLRNHGHSPHTLTMTYDEMASDVLHYVGTRFGKQHHKLSLVGHSMGGKVAMAAALRSPVTFDKLVVVDVAPVTYPEFEEFNRYIRAMQQLDLQSIRTRSDADKILAPVIPNPMLRGFLLKNLYTLPGDHQQPPFFGWRLNLPALQHALPQLRQHTEPAAIAKYDRPALFVRGSSSHYINLERGDLAAIQRLFPRARLETIEGAGHWVHADKPKEFVELLREFLSSES